MIVVLAAGAIVMLPIDPTAAVMRPTIAIVEDIDHGNETKHEDVQVKLHRPCQDRHHSYLLIPTMIIMDTIEEPVLLRRLMLGDTEVRMTLDLEEGLLCHHHLPEEAGEEQVVKSWGVLAPPDARAMTIAMSMILVGRVAVLVPEVDPAGRLALLPRAREDRRGERTSPLDAVTLPVFPPRRNLGHCQSLLLRRNHRHPPDRDPPRCHRVPRARPILHDRRAPIRHPLPNHLPEADILMMTTMTMTTTISIRRQQRRRATHTVTAVAVSLGHHRIRKTTVPSLLHSWSNERLKMTCASTFPSNTNSRYGK